MNFMKRSFKNFGIGVLSEILNMVTALFTSFYLTKKIGIEVYGEIVLINVIIGSITTFLSFSPSEALVKFLKKFEGQLEIKRLIILLNLIFVLFCALLVFILVYFFGTTISIFFSRENLTESLLLCSFIFFTNLFLRIFIGFFQSYERFFSFYFYQILSNTLKIILLLILVNQGLIIESKDVFTLYLNITIFITLIAFIEFSFFYVKEIGFGKIFFRKLIIKDFIDFILKSFSIASLKSINSKSTELLIGYYGSDSTLGIFNLIKKYAFSISQLSTVFATRYYPLFMELQNLNNIRGIENIIIKSLKFIISAYFVFAILTILFWEQISIYFEINQIGFYLILVSISTALISTSLWWVKIFSYTININYSIIANSFKLFLILLFTPFLVNSFNLIGGLISELIIVLLLSFYWFYIFIKSKHETN